MSRDLWPDSAPDETPIPPSSDDPTPPVETITLFVLAVCCLFAFAWCSS